MHVLLPLENVIGVCDNPKRNVCSSLFMISLTRAMFLFVVFVDQIHRRSSSATSVQSETESEHVGCLLV